MKLNRPLFPGSESPFSTPSRGRLSAHFLIILLSILSLFASCAVKDLRYHYIEGVRLEKEGKFPEAVKSYLEILKLNERHFSGLFNLANLYMQQKNYKDARKYYVRAILERTNFAPAYFGLGLAYYNLKDSERCRKSMKMATVFDPMLGEAYIMGAWSYYEDGKPEESVKELNRCIKANPSNTIALYNLGWVEYEQGRLTNSIAHLRTGVKYATDDYRLLLLLGKALLKNGNRQEAGAVLATVRKLKKTHILTRLLEAEYLSSATGKNDAIKLLDDIIRKYPDNYQARLLQGEILFREGHLDRALRSFTAASALEYKLSRPRIFMIDIYLAQKKTSLALKELYLLRKTHPGESGVLSRLLKLQFVRKEFDRAINTGKMLLKKDPSDRDALYYTGMSLLRVDDPALKDVKLAIPLLWKILDTHKTDKVFLTTLLDALKETGDRKRIRAVERLLK